MIESALGVDKSAPLGVDESGRERSYKSPP